MASELEAMEHLVRRCSELLESFPTSCSEDEMVWGRPWTCIDRPTGSDYMICFRWIG